MDSLLSDVEGARSFLDDLKVQGSDWRGCWRRTLEALTILARAGFMLNLRKSKLLVAACDLLGHWVTSATIALNLKYLKRWLGVDLPKNLREVCGILGKLQWPSPFVPDFKHQIAPIEVLLRGCG